MNTCAHESPEPQYPPAVPEDGEPLWPLYTVQFWNPPAAGLPLSHIHMLLEATIFAPIHGDQIL